MSGYGTLTLADGKVYYGNFENDKKNGEGFMTHPDGSTITGNWVDDVYQA